jgi:hypothetical protein
VALRPDSIVLLTVSIKIRQHQQDSLVAFLYHIRSSSAVVPPLSIDGKSFANAQGVYLLSLWYGGWRLLVPHGGLGNIIPTPSGFTRLHTTGYDSLQYGRAIDRMTAAQSSGTVSTTNGTGIAGFSYVLFAIRGGSGQLVGTPQ